MLPRLLRYVLAGLFCIVAAAGAVLGLSWLDAAGGRPGRWRPTRAAVREVHEPGEVDFDSYRTGALFLDEGPIEDGGFGEVVRRSPALGRERSLAELHAAVLARGDRAEANLRAELAGVGAGPDAALQTGNFWYSLALLRMYQGRFAEADEALARSAAIGRSAGISPKVQRQITALRGIAALRRGEVSNCVECVGPSSCIFPIAPEAVHQLPDGSRAAYGHFAAYLEQEPGDLRMRWLLNIAAMTLGDYPERVPPRYRMPLEGFRSEFDVGRFTNVAAEAGLGRRGPNLAGGAVFDDFDGDGRPDLFLATFDPDLGACLFVNRGDGTFEPHPEGLADQVYVQNAVAADYDNDGDLDVLLLRGAYEAPMRLTLLENRGDATFADVTEAAGMATPIQTEAAAWGDFDDDGLADLYVCGEYLSFCNERIRPDPRNRCRLYRNLGDGTFVDVAEAAGVTNDCCAKGAAWGDYDGDDRLDLLVSNMSQPCKLYRNRGDGTFEDVAPGLGVRGPDMGLSCWFFDYDNDGRLDIYINENKLFLSEEVAVALGRPGARSSAPKLYRNLGPDGFRDVTAEAGLARGTTPMGSNIGDIDNDGYLDFYIGTGGMSFEHLVPNRLFKNVDGRRFADVTTSSGTGHLQKGHGISFADYDDDGDLDLFVVAGGAVPGDRSYNVLFRNPGHGRHWLKVRLVGTQTNRSALGARIQATLRGPGGRVRSIYRTVGNNSSYGGNSLVETIGLGDAARVAALTVSWPTSRTVQTFRDLDPDRTVTITEGSSVVEVLAPRPVATLEPGPVGR